MPMVNKQRRFQANYHKEDVFEVIPKVALGLKGFSLVQTDQQMYTYLFKTKISMYSWGEQITVCVKDAANGGSEITISSVPKMISFSDNGKNSTNVTQIINGICQELKNYPAISDIK